LCGDLAPGEPNRCAITMHGPGEPWAYHILNRYFDSFIPKGIALAEQARGSSTPYKYGHGLSVQPGPAGS
jgi:hypothetical protein